MPPDRSAGAADYPAMEVLMKNRHARKRFVLLLCLAMVLLLCACGGSGKGLQIESVDSEIYSGYKIPPFYDSMIAKLIVSGKTRNGALMRLHRALEEFVIDGIKTTIPLHQKIIAQPDYVDGLYNIHWLENLLNKS